MATERQAGSPERRSVPDSEPSARPSQRHATPLVCQRCGFPVASRAMGCKHPCANCGTVYPLGDCSD